MTSGRTRKRRRVVGRRLTSESGGLRLSGSGRCPCDRYVGQAPPVTGQISAL